MADRISKRRVDASMPGTVIWDGDIPGFGLRTTKSGAKSYVLKYRLRGVQRWLTIGRHGAPWTPVEARRAAKMMLGNIQAGQDPALERSEDRTSVTLSMFSERYLEEYAKPHKKASSVVDDEGNLKNHILPALGRLRVKDIAREDVARFHMSMKEKPYAANRCRALLAHMFKKAEAWGVRPDGSNPTTHVEKFKEKARDRFLSMREIMRLGRALRVVERAGRRPYEVAAIRLLFFTGARLSEILTLKWDYVDHEMRVARLPDSKTGAKTIVLPAPALAVISSLPRQEENPYVICGWKEGAHLVNLQKPWQRIRKAALIPDVRLHDLRHSFASVAAASGMSLPLIGSLLGHSQVQTTARYAHLSDDPRLAAAETIGSTIAASMSGKSSEVALMRRSR